MPTLESGVESALPHNLRLGEGLVPQRNVRMQVAEEKVLGCKKKSTVRWKYLTKRDF